MKKNCLVTKYKATVNDNSLLKVGEMFIDIIEQESPTNQTNRLYLNTNYVDDLVVEVENGAANLTLDENMASGWTNKITLPKSFSPAPIFVRNGNYRIKVTSKYNLTEVGRYTASITQKAISVDTQYLKYSPNITNLYCILSGKLENLKGCTKLIDMGWYNMTYGNLTGSLSDLAPLTALTRLNISSAGNLTGSLSDLAPLTALTRLNIRSVKNLTGSLSDLAPLTALTDLDVGNDSNITGDIKDIRHPLTNLGVYNTNITGELIEFVKTQRAEGRTTGSCNNAGWWGNNITFNGSTTGLGTQTLSWTENTITNNGVTVNQ